MAKADKAQRASTQGAVVEGIKDPYLREDYFWKRKGALWTERASWDGHAKELAQNLLPRASRFTTSETNKGGNRHNKIYDSTGPAAIRILAAGLMSGLTSPARPWFRLKHADDDMMEYEPVKLWCSQVTRQLLRTFAKSNIYRALHQGYTELSVFGTHANLILPDADTVVHATPLTWGEYALATDAKNRVDTLYREFQMTASAMVRSFGYDNCSNSAQRAYNTGNMDSRFDVVHAIEPNPDVDLNKMDPRSMAFVSCYFEQGQQVKGKFLRQSGFRRFRALAPRWSVTGQDVYGESPGMEMLGDAKQLQHEQFRKAQGIDYMTKPPIGMPTSARGQEIDALPGGVTFFDQAAGPSNGQRQLFDVNLNLQYLLEDIIDVRGRINRSGYADLFMMIASADQNMTATEVAERHEEKLLMLGPVLERQQNENIDPLIDMTFEQLAEAGLLPPPPPELEGQPLETELLGILAQAQRAVQANTVDRFIVGVGNIANILGKPEVGDKINGDGAVDVLADSLGVDPRLLTDDRDVAKQRMARAQAQQQAQDAAKNAAIAKGVGELGGVPTQGGASNAGADAIGMFSGYQSPQAERLAG